MIRLCLTFDYELFFNDTDYSEEEVLIKPTYSIMNCLNSCGAKATFFVDTAAVAKYKELGMNEFPEAVKSQMIDILGKNSDIQLHIHPIWLNANLKVGKWCFDNNYYMLDAFENVGQIIKKCKKELDFLCHDANGYNCIAYRAGGFCLSPEKEILSSIYDLGIRIDSSVYPRIQMNTTAQRFDYRKVGDCKSWYFDYNNGIYCRSVEKTGVMMEVPVTIYSKLPSKWVLTHGIPKLNYPSARGKTTPIISVKRENRLHRLFSRVRDAFSVPVLFTMDTLHYQAMIKIVDYYRKENMNTDYLCLCAIGHPKFQSEQSIENLKKLLDAINLMDDVEYVTMNEMYHMFFDQRGDRK